MIVLSLKGLNNEAPVLVMALEVQKVRTICILATRVRIWARQDVLGRVL